MCMVVCAWISLCVHMHISFSHLQNVFRCTPYQLNEGLRGQLVKCTEAMETRELREQVTEARELSEQRSWRPES